MSIASFKEEILRNYTNATGFRTNRKIIVFESDDWGSIMMRDKLTYERLLQKGIRVDSSKYSKLDCLETGKDLDDLFNVLKSHKDINGNYPKFTFNTVMENPDFEKIRESGFQNYYGERFSDSYKTYYNEDNLDLWFEAIKEGIMVPQFHAREHFNKFFWMNDLKNKNQETLFAFENFFFGMGIKTTSQRRSRYLPTYYAENDEEHKLIEESLKIGLEEFKQLFGFYSKTFIASNYTWSRELECVLHDNFVKGLQGSRVQLAPNFKTGKMEKIRHFTGDRNRYNQIYTVRNASFEPYSDFNGNWIDRAMKDISNSFFWKKPAIFETHRINYVSIMSKKNQENNLSILNQLLKKIILTYPEVEFLSSDELLEVIQQN